MNAPGHVPGSPLRLCFAGAALTMGIAAHGQTLTLGTPFEAYSSSALTTGTFGVSAHGIPQANADHVIIDAAPATVWYNGILHVFVTNFAGIDVYRGMPDRPLGDLPLSNADLGLARRGRGAASAGAFLHGYPAGQAWQHLPSNSARFLDTAANPNNPRVWAWIPNMYKVTKHDEEKYAGGIHAGDLIGFVHLEKQERAVLYQQCSYSIGLAFCAAADTGARWKLLVDNGGNDSNNEGGIIRPEARYGALMAHGGNNVASADSATITHNIGGVPYLEVTVDRVEYFYVYFNEWTRSTPAPSRYDPKQHDNGTIAQYCLYNDEQEPCQYVGVARAPQGRRPEERRTRTHYHIPQIHRPKARARPSRPGFGKVKKQLEQHPCRHERVGKTRNGFVCQSKLSNEQCSPPF